MGGYPWLKERSKPSETLTKTKMEIEPNQRHLAFRHSPAPVLTTHSKHYAIRLWPTASPQTSCSGMLHTLRTLLPLPIQFKVTQPRKKGPPLQNLESTRRGLCASARPEPYAQHEASCAQTSQTSESTSGLAPTFPGGSEAQLCGKQVNSIPF